ncbi:MAG: lysophospholipid acyltransferase family protein [Anaerorhabdus sp.]|uniref:lysophospholipid acyltransferase family protein n=1 Tax=Anaerorhabdus sp. TaxID=1872524 RepID=UPI003A8800E5
MFRLLKGGIYILFTGSKARRLKNASFEERYKAARECCLKFFKLVKTPVIYNDVKLPEGPVLFVSNHQGTIDPLVIVAALEKPTTFISKQENKKIPIISTWASLLDLIYFDRDDQASAIKMLRESTRWLKSGKSVLVFPEGTRSKSKKVNEFHEASLKPAYLAKASIVPITLHNVYEDFNNIKSKKPYRITIGKLQTYEIYKDKNLEELAKELQQEIEMTIQTQ